MNKYIWIFDYHKLPTVNNTNKFLTVQKIKKRLVWNNKIIDVD